MMVAMEKKRQKIKPTRSNESMGSSMVVIAAVEVL
jgi:hypothetical protein